MRTHRIIFALLMGGVITIAISWLAMFLPTGQQWYGPKATRDVGLKQSPNGIAIWQISRGDNVWHGVVTYWRMQISGLSVMIPRADYEAREAELTTLPAHLRPESIDDLNMMAWYHEVGWPFRALTCSVHWKQQISNADILYTVQGGVQLPRDADFNPRALPLTPLWPGALLNVLVWGAAWWVLAAIVRTGRSRWRIKRGRCVRCAYPRTGLPIDARCPECGALGPK